MWFEKMLFVIIAIKIKALQKGEQRELQSTKQQQQQQQLEYQEVNDSR